jgi:AraC-like DNA-binding protein
MRNLTRGATLANYDHVARSVGLDPLRMLRSAKLPAKVLDEPDLLISVDAVGWLLEESARLSGQEAFGLLLAEARSLADLGMLALLVREEPTLRRVLESLARYMRVHNDGVQLHLEDAGDLVFLRHDMKFRRKGGWRQAIELSNGVGVRALRMLTRNAFRPVRVCFTHERPRSLDIHRRVLGTAIDFSQEFNAIICRARDLDIPIPTAELGLDRDVRRWLDAQLAHLEDEPLAQVRQVVRLLLPTGRCSVERVAEHLGLNRRTLNRHLARQGESVVTVINAVRAELAETYLAGSKRKLYEVAELLGFDSAANFSRWFRNGFGVPPSQWVADRRLKAAADSISKQASRSVGRR